MYNLKAQRVGLLYLPEHNPRACYDITLKIGFLGTKVCKLEKMQSEETTTSFTTMMDPWAIFLYGMKAPLTRSKYGGRLAKLF